MDLRDTGSFTKYKALSSARGLIFIWVLLCATPTMAMLNIYCEMRYV